MNKAKKVLPNNIAENKTESVKVSSFETFSEDFSKTRQRPWKEFDLFIPYINHATSILDVGCGNGRLYDFIKKTGYKGAYTGIDISENLISICKKTYPEAHFQVGNMTDIPLENKTYDLVIASASLHHLQTKKERSKAISEIQRVQEENGNFIGIVWNLHQKRFHPLWLNLEHGWRNIYVPWNGIGNINNNTENKIERFYYAFNKSILKKLLNKDYDMLELDYVSGTKKQSIFTAKNLFFACCRK